MKKNVEEETQKHLLFFVLSIFLFVLVILGFIALYFVGIANGLNHDEFSKENLGVVSMPKSEKGDKQITNIALFGVDQRNEQTQVHSDAVMILSIDKAHNKIKITSVMRDLLVDIEGHGENKMNSAYFKGGAELAVKTLNQNLLLDITEYATVNFQQMASIIDAVGGIEIDVSEAERLDANNSIYEQASMAGLPKDIIKKPGLQTLSGTQAVAFARIRYVKTSNGVADDFGRTDRQRLVMSKLFDKALDMNVLKYPEFARKVLPAVVTSLDFGELLQQVTIMLEKPTFEELRLPRQEDLIGDGTKYVGGQQCLYADVGKMSQALRDFIYEDLK